MLGASCRPAVLEVTSGVVEYRRVLALQEWRQRRVLLASLLCVVCGGLGRLRGDLLELALWDLFHRVVDCMFGRVVFLDLLPSDILDPLADLPNLRFVGRGTARRRVVFCFFLRGFEGGVADTILLRGGPPVFAFGVGLLVWDVRKR